MSVTYWRIHIIDLSDRNRLFVKHHITDVCAAVSLQAQEEFNDAWKVSGTLFHNIDVQEKLRAAELRDVQMLLKNWMLSLQPDEAVLYLVDEEALAGSGQAGFHLATARGSTETLVQIVMDLMRSTVRLGRHPYSFVRIEKSTDWTITLSHEVLELLADPYATNFTNFTADGRSYIKEVCDAVQAIHYRKNDVMVSDFVYPEWFVEGSDAKDFDFRRVLKAPFELARGGYISYMKRNGAISATEWYNTPTPVEVDYLVMESGAVLENKSIRLAQYAKNAMALVNPLATTAAHAITTKPNGPVISPKPISGNPKSANDFAEWLKTTEGRSAFVSFPAVKVVHLHTHHHSERIDSAGVPPSNFKDNDRMQAFTGFGLSDIGKLIDIGVNTTQALRPIFGQQAKGSDDKALNGVNYLPTSTAFKDNQAISVNPALTGFGLSDIGKLIDIGVKTTQIIRPFLGQHVSASDDKPVEALRDGVNYLATPAALNGLSSPRESASSFWDGTLEDLKQKAINCLQSAAFIDVVTGLVKEIPLRIEEVTQKLRENMQKSKPNAFVVPQHVIGEIGVCLTEGKTPQEEVQYAALKIALHNSLSTTLSSKIWNALKHDTHIGSFLHVGLVRDLVAPMLSAVLDKLVDHVYHVLSEQIKEGKSLAAPDRNAISKVIGPSSAAPRMATGFSFGFEF